MVMYRLVLFDVQNRYWLYLVVYSGIMWLFGLMLVMFLFIFIMMLVFLWLSMVGNRFLGLLLESVKVLVWQMLVWVICISILFFCGGVILILMILSGLLVVKVMVVWDFIGNFLGWEMGWDRVWLFVFILGRIGLVCLFCVCVFCVVCWIVLVD